MRKLARQISEAVGHIQNALTLWGWIVSIGGGAVIAVWAFFEEIGLFLSFMIGLCSVVLLAALSGFVVNIYRMTRSVADTLSEFRTVGVELRNRHITGGDELKAWRSEGIAWRADTEAFITKRLGAAKTNAVFVLNRYIPSTPDDLPPAFNKDHRKWRNELNERLARLEKLIDSISK